MIHHISIRNFAIIENTEIDFTEGLNIITGETGSGKSIVIEAISLALGSRADSAFVRHGAQKAVVQLAGELNGEEVVITREVSAAGDDGCLQRAGVGICLHLGGDLPHLALRRPGRPGAGHGPGGPEHGVRVS